MQIKNEYFFGTILTNIYFDKFQIGQNNCGIALKINFGIGILGTPLGNNFANICLE